LNHATIGAGRTAPAWLLVLVTLAGVACSSSSKPGANDSGTGGDAGVAIFPATFRGAGFQMVRACRAPGEHSGLNGFTVWVDDADAATYDRILSGGGGQQMPYGAVVIKELFNDRDCTVVDRWVAMKKTADFDPAHGDWYWQDVAPTRAVLREGQLPACSDCHEGTPDGTCAGFGTMNGMDYLCTAP
jgi:hypothetical protein